AGRPQGVAKLCRVSTEPQDRRPRAGAVGSRPPRCYSGEVSSRRASPMQAAIGISWILRRLVEVSCWRPWLTVSLALVLAAAGAGHTLRAVTFQPTARALLPQRADYVVRYAEYAKEFGELEDIVVAVEAGSFESARAYAARLTQELRAAPTLAR